MSLLHCIHQTLNSKASTRFHSGGLQQSSTLILNTFLFGVIILIANILKRAFSSQLAAKDRKSGSAGMPRPISYAVFCLKKKKKKKSMLTKTRHIIIQALERKHTHQTGHI